MTLEIISIVLNLLFGSGFVISIIQLRAERKKTRAEGYRSEVDLVTSSVSSMIESQNSLMQHNQELIKALTASRKENAQLVCKIDDLEKKITVMVNTNKEIVKVLRKLKVDESIVNKLNDPVN